jgi:hypothetical protein
MSDDQQSIGERVLQEALHLAIGTWGERLVAVYALGSLAHGGFSMHVSDIDCGLVLRDPLDLGEAQAVDAIGRAVKAGAMPLAERLSLFWGSLATLAGEAPGDALGTRFPPLDRLDLKQWGRLLYGDEVRAALPAPTVRELVVGGAKFALQSLATPAVTVELKEPAALAHAGVIKLTKRVLFPVRFLYTARTGEIGRNQAAVDDFTAHETGPTADLARLALVWRDSPPGPDDLAVAHALDQGLLPLYRRFVEEYAVRLREYGEGQLAGDFEKWRRQLA